MLCTTPWYHHVPVTMYLYIDELRCLLQEKNIQCQADLKHDEWISSVYDVQCSEVDFLLPWSVCSEILNLWRVWLIHVLCGNGLPYKVQPFLNIIFVVVVVHQYTCSSKLGMFIPCLLYQCSQSRLLYSLKENVLLCPLEVIKLLSFSNSRSFQVERLWWLLVFLFFFFQYVVYFTKLFDIPFPLKERRKLTFLGRRVIFT